MTSIQSDLPLNSQNKEIDARKKTLQKRNLLYLASGAYWPEDESLSYDKVILVDKLSYSEYMTIPSNSKLEIWQMDALNAVNEIAIRELIIDCVVSVNEGLSEGNGVYVIFSEFLMGYLSPYLADDVLIVADFAYYGSARIKGHIAKMDWGFKKYRKIEPSNVNYINPGLFSIEKRLIGLVDVLDYGNVFHLKRKYKAVHKELGRNKLNLIHGSIWKDRNRLEAIGLSIPQ